MKKIIVLCCLICSAIFASAQTSKELVDHRISSRIDSSVQGEWVLIQGFEVGVPLDSVWNAYTTKSGWESWAVSLAEVDWRINGMIRTTYNKNGTIGDSSTIVLHILNYVPKKLITLQAELTKHFPEFMQADAKNFYNIISFEKLDAARTKVTSYGIGYRDTPKYRSLMKFFIAGNEKSYQQLITYLETGQTIK